MASHHAISSSSVKERTPCVLNACHRVTLRTHLAGAILSVDCFDSREVAEVRVAIRADVFGVVRVDVQALELCAVNLALVGTGEPWLPDRPEDSDAQ